MKVSELIQYLKTQNKDEEVIVFDGFGEREIIDIHDTILFIKWIPKQELEETKKDKEALKDAGVKL